MEREIDCLTYNDIGSALGSSGCTPFGISGVASFTTHMIPKSVHLMYHFECQQYATIPPQSAG